MARLTKAVREQLIENNEGFTTRTYYEGRNSREERIYTVKDGELHIRAIGKTSWADSRYDDEWVASDEETHRFLYQHQGQLPRPATEV